MDSHIVNTNLTLAIPQIAFSHNNFFFSELYKKQVKPLKSQNKLQFHSCRFLAKYGRREKFIQQTRLFWCERKVCFRFVRSKS